MSAIIGGIYQNGSVVLQRPVDWPEGAPVEVALVESTSGKVGMSEEDWPTDPEGISKLLQRWNEKEPLEMTEKEIKEWEAALEAQKEFEVTNSEMRMNRIQESFE